MNRFALSPIAPLNTPNSDGGGGVTYRTSWNFEAPYRGFYALKGAVDNGGRILVDNQEILSGGLNRPRNGLAGFKTPHHNLKKFFLTEGNHTITVEVENGNQTKYKPIMKKSFYSQDFQFPLKKRTLAMHLQVVLLAQFVDMFILLVEMILLKPILFWIMMTNKHHWSCD